MIILACIVKRWLTFYFGIHFYSLIAIFIRLLRACQYSHSIHFLGVHVVVTFRTYYFKARLIKIVFNASLLLSSMIWLCALKYSVTAKLTTSLFLTLIFRLIFVIGFGYSCLGLSLAYIVILIKGLCYSYEYCSIVKVKSRHTKSKGLFRFFDFFCFYLNAT